MERNSIKVVNTIEWNLKPSYVFRNCRILALRSSPVWLRQFADSTLLQHLHDTFCKSGRKSQCRSPYLSRIPLLWGIYGPLRCLVTQDIFSSFSTCSPTSTHFGNLLSSNAIRDDYGPQWTQYGPSHFRWFLEVWLDWLVIHIGVHFLQFQSWVWICQKWYFSMFNFAPKKVFASFWLLNKKLGYLSLFCKKSGYSDFHQIRLAI